MIFGQTQDIPTIDAAELQGVIQNRPTPLGEYFGAVTEQSFEHSLPGAMAAEVQLPDDDITGSRDPAAVSAFLAKNRRYPQTYDEIISVMQRTDAPIMSDDEYKASSFSREGIPNDGRMTEARARAKAEVYDDNAYNSWLRQNRAMGIGTVAAAVAGSVLGSAPDPVNYVPVFGPAFKVANAGRLGVVLARAGMGAAENMALTALESPLVAQSRRQFGEDITFADQLIDIALAGAFGGVVGGVAGRFQRLPDFAPDRVSTALQALGEAADSLANDRALDIGGAYRMALLHGTSVGGTERARFDPTVTTGAPRLAGDAIPARVAPGITSDELRTSGLNQPTFSGAIDIPTVRPNGEPAVYPADLTGFKSEVTRLTKAAEKEGRTLELRDLPNGQKELVETSRVEWLDQFPDEASARANLNRMTPEQRQGVDIVPVDTQARGRGVALIRGATPAQIAEIRKNPALAERIERTDATQAGPSRVVAGPSGESFSQAMSATAPERTRRGPLPRSNDTLAPDAQITTPERLAAAEASVGKPQAFTDAGLKERAADHGINAETGDFEEMADIQRLDAAEQLSAQDRADLKEADATVARTDDYAKAFKAAAVCMGRP